jgi:predicted acetyltransferase
MKVPIKKIPKKDFMRFVEIVANAFPGFGMKTEDDRKRAFERLYQIQKDDPLVNAFGYYRNNELLGGLRLFDFKMNFCSQFMPVGGGGLLAVNLMHKKEHVAKELMQYFLDYFHKKDTPVAALYPFRPDFYKKMGFGYGPKINEYIIRPEHFPKGKSKKHILFLDKKNLKPLIACYNRIFKTRHGMFEKCNYELRWLAPDTVKIAGYKEGKKIRGYMVFTFEKSNDGNILLNDMKISEFYYENRETLAEMCTFLNSQADQVNKVIITLPDDYFHHIPFDPRDSSRRILGMVNSQTNTQGIGLMFRVLNIGGLFNRLKNHDFNGQSLRLKINITDTFRKNNHGAHVVHFKKGKAAMKKGGACDAAISMDISDFSSMVMGIVPFRKLYEFNLAEISDTGYIDTVSRIFTTESKPFCTTQF